MSTTQAIFAVSLLTLVVCQVSMGMLLFLIYRETRGEHDKKVVPSVPLHGHPKEPENSTSSSGPAFKMAEKEAVADKPKPQLKINYTPKKLKGF